MDRFHAANPRTRLELRVTRRPYSWAGDDRSVSQEKIKYGSKSWRDAKGYEDDATHEEIEEAEKSVTRAPRIPMSELGRAASINFNASEEMRWQPVDAQRIILWATRFGKSEDFVEALSHRHFELAETCADRSTVLAAVGDVEGLDQSAAAIFLETDELISDVWDSYRLMIKYYGITEIPVFSFTRPGAPSVFSPAYTEGVSPRPYIVVGSASIDIFHEVFDKLYAEWRALLAPVDESSWTDEALRAKYLGRQVGLPDGRKGVVHEVESGGSLLVAVGRKLVRLRIRSTNAKL